MKKTLLILLTLCFCCIINGQEKNTRPGITLKWVPTGLIVGNINLQGEYNFGRNSITAKIGVPVKANHAFTYDDNEARFSMKAVSFLAGYRHYLSQKHIRGLYLEPFFKYVYHSSEGRGDVELDTRNTVMNFTNNYSGAGVGAQLGVQFLVGNKAVIDFFFLGPEINGASNKFKAIEQSNILPWTALEARDAERDIRDFIDKMPFIRNRTKLIVDRNNRRVIADFKGALPGYRIGVSLGIVL